MTNSVSSWENNRLCPNVPDIHTIKLELLKNPICSIKLSFSGDNIKKPFFDI